MPIKGKHMSEETKAKLSKIRKEKYSGINHPWYGRKHTEKEKENISQKNKGRIFTKEHRKKISLAMKGKKNRFGVKLSEETKLKISNALKGKGLGKKFTDEHKQKIGDAQRLNKNHNWKGGKYKNRQGYILIKKPEHPFCNSRFYICQHRLIMEKHLGRYLTEEEVVHHINGIPSDNKIENLMLFSSDKEHLDYHRFPK